MPANAQLAASLERGAHALLHGLVGRWEGRARVWLRPDALHAEEAVRGEVTPLHGGRWVRHDYETQVQGEDASGTALVGFALDRGVWQAAWVDAWHTGAEIFLSEGPYAEGDTKVGVATTYGGTPESPPWGWRTELERRDERLLVRHYNVTPAGEEALAVELDYAPA